MVKWDLSQGMQEFSNILQSINVKYHVSKLKDKNHIIISLDADFFFFFFYKIQHLLMIKILQRVNTEGTYLNITHNVRAHS